MGKPKYILDSEKLKKFYKRYGYDITISSALYLSPNMTATNHTPKLGYSNDGMER